MEESAGPHQYGPDTADGVNMVVLMLPDTLQQNIGHGATAVDGQSAFKCNERQKNLVQIVSYIPPTGYICRMLVSRPLHSGSTCRTTQSELSGAERELYTIYTQGSLLSAKQPNFWLFRMAWSILQQYFSRSVLRN